MKTKQPGKQDRTTATSTPTNSLRELMKRKPCYTPFSLPAIIEVATPRKPSMPLPTSDLVARLRNAAQELLNRAFAGEPDATKDFCWFAHNLIRQLTSLSEKKKPEISSVAATYEDWPILYAPDNVFKLTSTDDMDAQGIGTTLLADIRQLFKNAGVDKLPSVTICNSLAEIEGREWAEWGRARRPISTHQLAKLLRHFNVSPHGIRVGDETPRGYYLADFAEAFSSYLPEPPASECNSAT